MNKNHVLLLSAGVGQGHHAAASAIVEAVAKRYPNSVNSTIVNVLDHPDTSNVLREGQSDYDWIATDWPKLHEVARRMTDSNLTRSVTEMAQVIMFYRPISSIIKEYRPDIIVSLYPAFQSAILVFLHQYRSHIPLLTVPTDLGELHRLWFHPGVDLCLVPNQPANLLAQKYGLAGHQIKVTGLPVNPKLAERPASIVELRLALGWQPETMTMLIVGSKRVKSLELYTHILNHTGFPLQFILVAGGNDVLYKHFLAEHWHRPAATYNFVNSLHTMMQAADCILTKAGGLVTAESLAAGLPMLFSQAILKQEQGNAVYVVHHGAGDLTEDPFILMETLCHWLEDGGKLHKKRAENARTLGRPAAAYSVAEVIKEIVTKARMPRLGLEHEESSIRDLLQYFGLKL